MIAPWTLTACGKPARCDPEWLQADGVRIGSKAPGVNDPAPEDTPVTGSRPSEPRDSRRNGEGPVARRGVRTVVLSVVALAGLAALAVGVLWSSLGPPEGTASGRGAATETARTDNAPAPSGAEGPVITGTISVASELRAHVSEGDTLFIIARKGAGGAGAPFAVRRISEPRFPLHYRLGPEDVMMPGAAFEGEMHVSVRLSMGGAAGPVLPGDLEGEHPGEVPAGARGVDIVIARVR